MALVYVGLGSNIDPEQNLRLAFGALKRIFSDLKYSPVYQCQAVGFEGEDFLNMVASFKTSLTVRELQKELKLIETASGRTGKEPKWSGRTLDIDILTYDNCVGITDGIELPREDIVRYAYVLKPLADMAPEVRHPVLGKTYLELWEQFDGTHHIKPVNLNGQI